jgi:AcrR family transcriptional regulator
MSKTIKRKVGRPRDDGLRARRREEILGLASKVFAQRGYSQTDLQIVADKLGVGKGTIYRYFPTKRALFLAAADWGIRRLMNQVKTDTQEVADPLERIRMGIHSYLSFFDANPEVPELLIQERAEFKDRKKPTYFEHKEEGEAAKPWQELLQNLIAEGRVRAISVSEIMDVVGNLMYGTMFTNFFMGREKNCEEQVREMVDIIFNGILTENERKK